jgi:hypothetical protein
LKNILLSCVVTLFIASCASISNNHSVLFQRYSQYKVSADKNNIINIASKYFSRSLLGNDYSKNLDASDQLLFKNYMTKIDSHFEKINVQSGCLTINGYDEENAPLIFSLKYVSDNGVWLISKIHVVFVKSTNSFSKSAKCPSEYAN